ncbi:acetylornithine deacetylase/succinyl-diaminopimelate desuccinylase-like protein [Catenuloplanes nepalensis]|uniref:Acetylornithine deacetylase/succinyl-diaminopimelate desuccinylase-like protein n=1 Tax=Catenuloplanes nepalensis TaxID=587533 RepID=A0ABT9MPM1_9ACTN|nr:M20/M25/M40 family metallo-hydrolase [Catenuloplanes nepalensis]MDP9793347.1 acetylornithine deacetylase/succinyl-diaminopimelate desuccinylase-like protein [Catenuloplanes nepalensis]
MNWIRLPSVAGVPENEIDLTRSAHWLAGALRETGFPEVEIAGPGGAPAVIARWCAAPGAPTVLVYSHHDVRAAKEEQWAETSPHRPVLRDGYVYGRGASDAKGQVVAHLWGLRAHLAATGRAVPAVNLIWLVEGEEETGSAHLAALLEEHRIRADLVVYSDTLLWHRDHPAICTSMRGGLNAQIEVYGPLRDVHSGAVSGPAPNPLVTLARLIGRLHDDKGRVTLPGFYDTVIEPSERTRAEYAALPYSDEDWLARTETRSIGGEEGFTVLERLWARPAVEVLTAVAGDPDGPTRGAVPAVATASITMRTAPGQACAEVADQLRRWVRETIDEGVGYELTIAEELAQEPYRTPDDHPAVAMLEAAVRDGFGTQVVGRMGNAGGGPADLLTKATGAPVLFFGTGLPEDRWHDSDERASVDVLLAGAATLGSLWGRLAQWSR